MAPIFQARLTELDLTTSNDMKAAARLLTLYAVVFPMQVLYVPHMLSVCEEEGNGGNLIMRDAAHITCTIPRFFDFAATIAKACVSSQGAGLELTTYSHFKGAWNMIVVCTEALYQERVMPTPRWAAGLGNHMMNFLDSMLPLHTNGSMPGKECAHILYFDLAKRACTCMMLFFSCYFKEEKRNNLRFVLRTYVFLSVFTGFSPQPANPDSCSPKNVNTYIAHTISVWHMDQLFLTTGRTVTYLPTVGKICRWLFHALDRHLTPDPAFIESAMSAAMHTGILFNHCEGYGKYMCRVAVQEVGDSLSALLAKLYEVGPALGWEPTGPVPTSFTVLSRSYGRMLLPVNLMHAKIQDIGAKMPALPVVNIFCIMAEHLGSGMWWSFKETSHTIGNMAHYRPEYTIELVISDLAMIIPGAYYPLFRMNRSVDTGLSLAEVCRCYEAMLRAFINIITLDMPKHYLYKKPLTNLVVKIANLDAQRLVKTAKRTDADLKAALSLVHTVSKAVTAMTDPRFIPKLEKQDLEPTTIKGSGILKILIIWYLL